MSVHQWDNFWKDQKNSFHEVMKISTTFFASRLETLLEVKSGDEIFDYGCGPGFLSDNLAAKQIKIAGADINHLFVEQSKKNHPDGLFVTITTDTVSNKKILAEALGAKKFDFVVLLSITQYFKNVDALESVISMLCHYLKEDGKMVIADVIDQNTSSLRDASALLFQCVKKGKVIAFVKFMFYLFFSDYRDLNKNVNLLEVPEESITRIADNNSLRCTKLKGLTLHPSRANYILTKK